MKFVVKIALLATVVAFQVSAQDKFDSMSLTVLDAYHRLEADPTAKKTILTELPISINGFESRSGANVSIIVMLNDGATASDVANMGFEITTDLDDLVVANGPISQVEALAECDFVKSISFSQRREPLLKAARLATGGQDVQDGVGLPQKYTGEGVIAGIWDTGIDANHVNFLDKSGNSRISRFWHYYNDGQAIEYTSDNISRYTIDYASETHGTHTLGCLAGSWNTAGNGNVAVINSAGKPSWSATTKNPYYGMAPGAEIVAASGLLYDNSTIGAITNISNYALSTGKPCVINLSLGSNAGSHDGTDAMGQALSRIADRGAIIFVAAGNEGQENISVVKDFTASDNSVSTFISTPAGSTVARLAIWGATSEQFTVTVQVYNLQAKRVEYSYDIMPSSSGTSYRLGLSGVQNSAFSSAFTSDSYITLSTSTNTATNNRYSVSGYFSLTPNSTTNAYGSSYAIGIKVAGKAGQHIDITSDTRFTSHSIAGYVNGTPDLSINNLACSPKVISVGSWNAQTVVPVKDYASSNSGTISYENSYKVGDVSDFSSYGTLVDGRKLPEVMAPGLAVISSISTYYYESNPKIYVSASQTTPNKYAIQPGRTNVYYNMSGTSMATPIAAGGVALWLQANPTLTVEDVKAILKASNVTTNLPAATPMARWGGGKIDVLAGIKYVLSDGIADVVADSDDIVFTPMGFNQWSVFVAGAKTVNVEVYNLAGVRVASFNSQGDSLDFSADNLDKGIYVVNVNDIEAHRIAVK